MLEWKDSSGASQVMLVTLQKESQLLDRTDPTETTYNAAWGWHCPDTGPGGTANCDPAYAGLVNQAYGMAKQWARYRVDPGKYNYQAGQTVTIFLGPLEPGEYHFFGDFHQDTAKGVLVAK